MPSGEEHSLLNLPDMYHEIGHLLHSMFGGISCETSGIIIDKHFAKEIVRVQDDGTAAQLFKEKLEEAKYLWEASWLEEFTCDLVGTYMTGASYALVKITQKNDSIVKNDTAYILSYLGEGYYDAWYKGEIIQFQDCDPSFTNCNPSFTTLKSAKKTEWWVIY